MEGKEKTNHINNCIKDKYKWSKQLKGRDSQIGWKSKTRPAGETLCNDQKECNGSIYMHWRGPMHMAVW